VAHVLERIGLAMAGATCGLLVGTQVGASIAALTSQAFLLVVMIGGGFGFYLGIDTPPLEFQRTEGADSRRIDSAELLTAVGTFLATLMAFVSMGVIVFRESPAVSWNMAILLGWVAGLTMQTVAGTIARTRARRSVES
jgi:hypothetical protein